jgi:protein FAM32A
LLALIATEAVTGILTKSQLEEKLMREGVKTHKERVEELNKYLSTLSEHHDMPRIGPG